MGLSPAEKERRKQVLDANLKVTMYTDLSKDKNDLNGYVFISYKSVDWEKVFVGKVFELQKHGLRVYSDKSFEDNNQYWLKNMDRNLTRASALIMFISTEYLKSYATLIELLTAIHKKRPIVPIFFDEKEELFSELEDDYSLDDEKVSMTPSERNAFIDLLDPPDDNKRFEKSIEKIRKNITKKIDADDFVYADIVKAFRELLNNGDFNENSFNMSIESLISTIKDAAKGAKKSQVFIENMENDAMVKIPETLETTEIVNEVEPVNISEITNTVQEPQPEKEADISSLPTKEKEFLYFQRAAAEVDDGQYILKKDSIINKSAADSCPEGAKRVRDELMSCGKLVEVEDGYRLIEDHAFRSASGAACFVAGQSVSGTVAWKEQKKEYTGRKIAEKITGEAVVTFEKESFDSFIEKYSLCVSKFKESWKAMHEGNVPSIPFSNIVLHLPSNITNHCEIMEDNWKPLFNKMMEEFYQSSQGGYMEYRVFEESKKGVKNPMVITKEIFDGGNVTCPRYQALLNKEYYFYNSYGIPELLNAMKKELKFYIGYVNQKNAGDASFKDVSISYGLPKGEFSTLFSSVKKYSLFGKDRVGNQSQMMWDVFEELVSRTPERIENLTTLTCVSKSQDVKNLGTKEVRPIYFRVYKEFNVNGTLYCVGTAYPFKDKINNIKRMLQICGFSSSVFKIDEKLKY